MGGGEPDQRPLAGRAASRPPQDAYGAGDSFAAGSTTASRPACVDPGRAHRRLPPGAPPTTASSRLPICDARTEPRSARKPPSASSACSSANSTVVRTGTSRREREELLGVGAGEVRDRAQHAFLPQVAVRERTGSPRTPPPGAVARAAGTSAPAGAKMIAASSGSGPRHGVARPLGAQRPRQRLSAIVLAREREHAPPSCTATWQMMWAEDRSRRARGGRRRPPAAAPRSGRRTAAARSRGRSSRRGAGGRTARRRPSTRRSRRRCRGR